MRKELSLENPDNEEQRFELFFLPITQHIFFHWFHSFSFTLNQVFALNNKKCFCLKGP